MPVAARRDRAHRAAPPRPTLRRLPVADSRRDGVEERMLGRQQRAGDADAKPALRRAPDTGARCRCGGGARKLDQRFMPFAPVSTASSTSSGKKRGSVDRRRVIGRLEIRRRPVACESSRAARRSAPARRSTAAAAARRAVIVAEVLLDAPQRVVGIHVADDDERRVVRHVVAAVVAVQIVAGHRLQIGEPADRRMPIRMRLERRRRQLPDRATDPDRSRRPAARR